MTEELKKKLIAKHTEETADATAYESLAHELRNAGHHSAAGILDDISHEEKSHALLIMHILGMDED